MFNRAKTLVGVFDVNVDIQAYVDIADVGADIDITFDFGSCIGVGSDIDVSFDFGFCIGVSIGVSIGGDNISLDFDFCVGVGVHTA